MKWKSTRRWFVDYAMTIGAGALYAIALKYFVLPSKVILTGTEGIATALSYYFDSYWLFIILYLIFQRILRNILVLRRRVRLMNKKILFVFLAFLVLCMLTLTVAANVDAYFGSYDFGLTSISADPDTTVSSYYPQIGLYGGFGLYGGGLYGGLYGSYGLGYLPILNYLGILYGIYGTDLGNLYSNPGGLTPDVWASYGITYHPLFGYYQPYNLFGNMFALTNLFSWW